MFKLFHNNTSDGVVAEVWIDKDAGLCKKYFKLNGITANGSVTKYTDYEIIRKFYNRDLYWTTRLKSKYISNIYEHGELADAGFYIIQEYVGDDLLKYYIDGTLHTLFPNITDQLEEMFKLFQQHNLYKKNNALSNLTGVHGQIKAFDFKYATHRTPETRILEIQSIDKWISKIDPDIKSRLLKYLD